jgi:hypothetical protein
MCARDRLKTQQKELQNYLPRYWGIDLQFSHFNRIHEIDYISMQNGKVGIELN